MSSDYKKTIKRYKEHIFKTLDMWDRVDRFFDYLNSSKNVNEWHANKEASGQESIYLRYSGRQPQIGRFSDCIDEVVSGGSLSYDEKYMEIVLNINYDILGYAYSSAERLFKQFDNLESFLDELNDNGMITDFNSWNFNTYNKGSVKYISTVINTPKKEKADLFDYIVGEYESDRSANGLYPSVIEIRGKKQLLIYYRGMDWSLIQKIEDNYYTNF